MVEPSSEPAFEISHETEPSETLIAGFASYGLAGLTAVSFIFDQLSLDQTGHITAAQLPPFTPFEDGTPRHHSRLYSRDDLNITVLVNDLFIPVWAADAFAKAVLEWTDTNGVEEITVLSGAPFMHKPEEHDVYFVATTDYQEVRLQNTDLKSVPQGYLNGVNASLMGRGINSPLRTGLIVTPVHERVPDVAAAIRLVNSVASLYEIDIDSEPLQTYAKQVEQYYGDLAEKLKTAEEEHQYDDRMYM
jgi:uncharacterized protein